MGNEFFSDDIYEQILIRLCVADLTRFKSVSTSWYSLISASRFGKKHFLYHKNNNTNHITYYGRIYIMPYTVCKRTGTLQPDKTCHIVGSSNGLVCVKRSGSEFILVNPVTAEVKQLQKPDIPDKRIKCCGFGYDSLLDDYKLVVGLKKDKDHICFQVLSLRSNVFKVIGNLKYGFVSKSRVGVLCNGAIHWLVDDYQNNKVVILSFDLSKEEFQEIPQPYEYRLCNTSTLAVIEQDYLCIYQPRMMYKWIMRKYNVQQSWYASWFNHNDVSHECLQIGLSIPDDSGHIIFSTSSNICSPIFVRSLVSPHFDNNGTLKRKRHAVDSNSSRKFIWGDTLDRGTRLKSRQGLR